MVGSKRIVVCVEEAERFRDRFAAPQLVFQGPALMGDVWGLLRHDVGTIVLIDCGQRGKPSAWHREIIDALAAGIRVIGGGRSGGLRAAELAGHGMAGCGWVFARCQDGTLERDDEILDSADGLALVDLRHALERAELDRAQAEAMVSRFAGLHYPQRTRQALRHLLWEVGISSEPFFSLLTDIRHQDALQTIELALATESSPDTAATRETMAQHGRWQWLRTSQRFRSFVLPQGVVSGAALLEWISDQVGQEHWFERSGEFFVLQWLEERGIHCPRSWVLAQEREHGHLLTDAHFLLANGLTCQELRLLLFSATTISWALAHHGELIPGSGGEALPAFALAWAEDNGIRPPGEGAGRWVIEKGPQYFGFDWDYWAALLEFLQRTGQAAEQAWACLAAGDGAGLGGRHV